MRSTWLLVLGFAGGLAAGGGVWLLLPQDLPQRSAAEMMDAAGATNIEPFAFTDRVPGFGIHELGVARMGNEKKTSVLNQFNQSHDIKNLFVVDGGAFVSGGCQNPTLTIAALAMRASEYMTEQMRTRAI